MTPTKFEILASGYGVVDQRNQAIAAQRSAYGLIEDDSKMIIDVYTHQCSLNVSAKDLAVMAETGPPPRAESVAGSSQSCLDSSASRRALRRSTPPATASTRTLLTAVLAAAFVLASTALAAPERSTKPTARPRVGLVLSGGGARGAAHIGVIEVLEELRVPVDLVTGTSMGSIVGGLYAAGLSPEELSAAIQSIDWVKVFADKPDRQDLSFRRKQDDRNFLTNLRLAFKGGSIYIPSGLVEGQKLDYLLRTLTLTSDGVAYIEDLPLPFRAVATDIVTGEAVVFDHGPLALAQRASMSIPAAFSPVIVDERLLVDGYVANNLPIDVAQEMGAEAVIAIDISTPAATRREELQSAVAISGQSGTFPVQESQRRQIERLKPADVLLRPELGDLSSASFTRMPEAIEAGRQAALAAKEALSRYSVSEAEYAQWRARHRRPPLDLPVIDEVRIENRSPLSDRVIRARIETRAGERLDLERLSDDLGRLYGTDAFERVRFDLRREQDRMVLIYQLDARERGAHFFRFGLNLESDIGNESNFNIALNHVWLPINAWNGEIRNEGQFGDTNRVSTELYQPIDAGDRFFAMPFAQYEQTDLDLFQGHDRVARFDLEQTLSGLFLGVNVSNDAQIRGGIGYLDGETRRKIGDPTLFHSRNFHGGVYAFAFEYDTLDDTRFPNDGSYLDLEGLFVREELGFRESFERVRGAGAIYRTFRRNTVGLTVSYSTSIGASSDNLLALHSLGGFLNLSAFERNSLVGRHAGFARATVYRRIASPAVFAWEFPVYAGGLFEIGNAWDHRSDIEEDLLFSTGPFFGVDTPLGPLYIAYAYGEGGEHQGYLFLGRSF